MLENPKILFLSCLGSYFYSIIQSQQDESLLHSLLDYLQGSQLNFQKLDPKEVQIQKGNNPWRFQPVVIIKDGVEIEINETFFDYLKRECSVVVEKHEMTQDPLLIDRILEDNKNGYYSICKVDEYHIKHNKVFYLKNSNRHYLLIKSIDITNSTFCVIDSEVNTTYDVSFSELEDAFYNNDFKHKYYFRVNCNEYQPKYNASDYEQRKCTFDDSYISSMINDMDHIAEEEKEYCYRGYRYNIISKIIPMIEYQKMLLMNSKLSNERERAVKLANAWKDLSIFMSFKILRNNFDFQAVQKKLRIIKNI